MKRANLLGKVFIAILTIGLLMASMTMFVFAESSQDHQATQEPTEHAGESDGKGQDSTAVKAIAAAAAIAIASATGALAMGKAISKSSESIARQPEAGDNIRGGLMLGLVFIETAVIFTLVVTIMILFVL